MAARPAASKDAATIQKVQALLQTNDDTSRFVGLAMLKAILDSSDETRRDEASVITLWASVPVKFLGRLLRTGSGRNADRKEAIHMLDLAVSVLHTFSTLLPDPSRRESKLTETIPLIISSLLLSSAGTTKLALETLACLVSQPDGAKVLVAVEDLSPLTELAPSQPLVLLVLSYGWLNSMAGAEDKDKLRVGIDNTIRQLVSSFKGTDGVPLLDFLASFLPKLDARVLPQKPDWLEQVTSLLRALVATRPTALGRAACTNLAATLLEVYPVQTPRLLFSDDKKNGKRFSHLLVTILLVDLRSSLPTLLGQVNSSSHADMARRLASAFDVISHYTGYLLRSLHADDDRVPPDILLKLRKEISDTMSDTIDFLRDRWHASFAGAMGLHPDARHAVASTKAGSHMSLAWDSMSDKFVEDPLVLAAVRALALWLREDDGHVLRKEATGLMDMLMELYRSSSRERLDFRSPVLVALEGITAEQDGVEALLGHDGWKLLASDLLDLLQGSSTPSDDYEAARGIELVRVLLPIVEAEETGTCEAWMDVITRVAAWEVPDVCRSPLVSDLQVAVLQLATSLLDGTHAGMRRRYVHSTSAILAIATQVYANIRGDASLKEAMEDVLATLASLD